MTSRADIRSILARLSIESVKQLGYSLAVGSKTFDGVWFAAYSHDHPPPHVHGQYADVQVIVDLLPDGSIQESDRRDAILPSNAKRSDVRHILEVASANGGELLALWRATHG
jgi:hypothetical protein